MLRRLTILAATAICLALAAALALTLWQRYGPGGVTHAAEDLWGTDTACEQIGKIVWVGERETLWQCASPSSGTHRLVYVDGNIYTIP